MISGLLRTVRFFRSPRIATKWAAEFVDDRITTPRHRAHLDYYLARQKSVRDGIARATQLEKSLVEVHLRNLPDFLLEKDKDPGMTMKWSATSELAATTYTLVRLLKPDTVIETGVGAGVSSWTILHAMEQNGNGRLISIDLPTPNSDLLPEVGYLVPNQLRSRWDLRVGPSDTLLPKTLQETGEVDIFQHDSRHSYKNQLQEYKTAWPYIRTDGLLVSDDVSNDALHDACVAWNVEPSIIGQSKDSPIGLVRKP